MNDSFIAKSLFDVLASRNKNLAKRFLAIQALALTDWIPLLSQDHGSQAGLVHLINVGRNVEKMIPKDKKKKLNDGEIFLLLTAILFHDIGRISSTADPKRPTVCQKHPLCKETACLTALKDPRSVLKDPRSALKNLCSELKDVRCEKRGWDHFRESEKLIKNHGEELGLPDTMAVQYCALLAYCHGLSQPPREKAQATFANLELPDGKKCPLTEKYKPEFRNTSIEPYGSVRIPLLAALLRIADETENHWTRAIHKRWKAYYEKNKENLYKDFRQFVEDVEFCHTGECIILHLEIDKVPKEKIKKIVNIARESDAVLKKWGQELQPLGLNFRQVFFESEGRLWRFINKEYEDEKELKDETRIDDIMANVMKDDSDIIRELVKSLKRLSNDTMGHHDFPWSAVEAEVGRPLTNRQRWLVERMVDWVPETISVDLNTHHIQVKDRTWKRLVE
jgi:hypothetical protein